MVGEPSPCDSFTLEKLSHNKAIMFGGCGTEEEMYIAKLTRRIVASALIIVNITATEQKTFVINTITSSSNHTETLYRLSWLSYSHTNISLLYKK